MKRTYKVFYDMQEVLEERRVKNPYEFMLECLNRYPNHDVLRIEWTEHGRTYSLSTEQPKIES